MLRHFEQATREISADKYLSVSKVIPLTSSLPCVIVERTSLRALKQKLLSSMARRFTNIEISYTLAVSTLLDPLFKKVGFGMRVLVVKQFNVTHQKLHQSLHQIILKCNLL